VWHLGDTLLLILAAVVLGEGLRPAIWALQRHGVPFGIATGLVYLALAGGLVLLLVSIARPLVGESTQLVQSLPGYQKQIQSRCSLPPSSPNRAVPSETSTARRLGCFRPAGGALAGHR
jgi:predicted PurR-regulated permease PerM